MDFPTQTELVDNSMNPVEIAKMLGVDSLGYISIEGLRACTGAPENFCAACFDGDYPEEMTPGVSKCGCGD
jgi:amidophosphoribosyltransferase